MNALNRIAFLAGGALLAVAATGCSSSTKPAASGAPATSSSNASNSSGASGATAAPSTPAAPGQATVTVTAPGGTATTTIVGGSTAPAAAAGGGDAAPADHPVCDNAELNASLWHDKGQPPTNPIIAVKNTGPTCMINPIPYLWIVKSPTDASDELRPLVPGGVSGTAKLQTFLSGTTLYAAVDLDPNSTPDNGPGYGYLEVTANPTRDSSGKDVQDLQLSDAMIVSNPKLSVYATNPGNALKALQYSDTPES